MGNISSLSRVYNNTLIDSLTYGYTNSGNYTNQVQSVADLSGNNAGLVAGTMAYGSYDPNGNTVSNTNTSVTTQNKNFTYNLLNLPLTAVTNTQGTDNYTYDATGQKLRKVNVNGSTTTTTDYISGIQYNNSTTTIGFIQTEEGKAVPTTSGGYDYTYYLGDNLGNTRITFDTQTGAAVVQQQDDYLPFGMEILRTSPTPNPKNEYLYNKKELQEELQEYDYGARFYDPVIARLNTVDPLAEISRRWSPYNYVENNPIRMIDPDGMDPLSSQELLDIQQEEAANAASALGVSGRPGANGSSPNDQEPAQTTSTDTTTVKAVPAAKHMPKPEKVAGDDSKEDDKGEVPQTIALAVGVSADAAKAYSEAHVGAVIYYSTINGVVHWVASSEVLGVMEKVSKASVVGGILIDGALYVTKNQSGAKTAANISVTLLAFAVGGPGGIAIGVGYYALDKLGVFKDRNGTYNIEQGATLIDNLKYTPIKLTQ